LAKLLLDFFKGSLGGLGPLKCSFIHPLNDRAMIELNLLINILQKEAKL